MVCPILISVAVTPGALAARARRVAAAPAAARPPARVDRLVSMWSPPPVSAASRFFDSASFLAKRSSTGRRGDTKLTKPSQPAGRPADHRVLAHHRPSAHDGRDRPAGDV